MIDRRRTRIVPLFLLAALSSCAGDASQSNGPPVVHPDPAPAPTTATAPSPVPAPAAEASTLPSGVVIRDITIGTGEPIPPGAVAEVNFVAKLSNGEVFDSTEQRKRALSFDLASTGLIRGLREGIPGMRPGGTRRIEIPWRLAYGESGRDPIPPKTDLIFEVELVKWDPAARAPN